MKKLIVAAILAISTAVHALNPSVVLTVGQWLLKNTDRVYYVQVEGRGHTEAEARRNGFALAVEQAVGTLVLSEREAVQQRLARNEVTNYSSGYVDNFKILNKTMRGNEVTVTMDVWVAHSAIANRLFGRSEVAGQVDGARIGAQVQTMQQSLADGDRIVSQVLKDFPRRAFDISLSNAVFRMDADRRTLLEIPFELKWNYNYIVSLHEALQATSQNPRAKNCWNYNQDCANQTYIRVVAKNPTSFAKWDNTLGFNDYRKHHLVNDAFINSVPVMQLVIRDPQNRVVFRDCYSWTVMNWSSTQSFVETRNNQIGVYGDLVRSSRIVVDLGHDSRGIDALSNIELSVVKAETCKA
jgi:hypothetical protein